MKVMLGLDATVPPAEEENDCAGPAVSLSRQLKKIRGDESNHTTSRPKLIKEELVAGPAVSHIIPPVKEE